MKAGNANKMARWAFYISGVIFIITGVLAIFNPFATVISSAMFMGIGIILAGINEIVAYFSMKGSPSRSVWMLLLGVVDIVVGFLLVSRIGVAVVSMTILFGAWVMASGLIRAFLSFNLRSIGVQNWWLMLVSGILLIIAAVILFMNPFAAMLTVAMMVAITLIFIGALAIMEGRALYPAVRDDIAAQI